MTGKSLQGVLSLILVACASHASHIRGPDGEDNWVSITCKRSQANCIERAGEECPNGYTVADASGHEGFYAQGQGGFMPAYAHAATVPAALSETLAPSQPADRLADRGGGP